MMSDFFLWIYVENIWDLVRIRFSFTKSLRVYQLADCTATHRQFSHFRTHRRKHTHVRRVGLQTYADEIPKSELNNIPE